MNILFRCDSSSLVGIGHVMRNLVLSKQFFKDSIFFAVQNLDGNINYKIEELDYEIHYLNNNSFQELNFLIKQLNIEMIVIDHYSIDFNFENKLKESNPNLKIFVLDDTYEKHNCDILLNHNISADKKKYKGLVPETCELRCGSKYTLLREEFIKEKKAQREKSTNKNIKTIFLSMGGSDAFSYNIKILEILDKYNNINVNVVTTSSNNNLNELEKIASKKKWIYLHINSNKIAKLIGKSDFCIVTPSVTISEVIYLEKTFIAFKVVENQDDIFQYLKKKKYYVTDKLSDIDKYLRKLINE